MHRLSEAMHIALLAARCLILSVAAKSRREVARQNQTSAYCSAGRIQWRVNNARARTAKSAPDASTMRNTGLAYATSHVPSLSLSSSIFLPRSFLSILEDSPPLPSIHSQPLRTPPATKRLRNSAGRMLCITDRDASVPL